MPTTRRAPPRPVKITSKVVIDEVIIPSLLSGLWGGFLTVPISAIIYFWVPFLKGYASIIAVVLFFTLPHWKRIWSNSLAPLMGMGSPGSMPKGSSIPKDLHPIIQLGFQYLLIRYGLWWDVNLLIGFITAFHLSGPVHLGIILLGGILIHYKIFKLVCVSGVLILWFLVLCIYIWTETSIRSLLSTFVSRIRQFRSRDTVRLGEALTSLWLLYYGLRSGPLWLAGISWMIARTLQINFPIMRFALSQIPPRFKIAYLEGFFKYNIFPSFVVISVCYWFDYRVAPNAWVMLFQTVTLTFPSAMLAKYVGGIAHKKWNSFKHYMILSHLPKEHILQPPYASNLVQLGCPPMQTDTLSDDCMFVYQPLNNPQQTFRLFILDELLQLSGEIVISGRLIHVSLRNPPPYISLSYSWGSNPENESIVINGKTFSITSSLKTALQNIRAVRNAPLPLWIDQICIDQKNDVEKGYQVKQMDQIYQHASSNLVWLGVGTTQSNRAFDMVRIMTREMPKEWDHLHSTIKNSHRHESLDKDTFSIEDWKAFEITFQKRSLWSRIWIVQELILANTVEFQCGSRVLQWNAIEFFLTGCQFNNQPGSHRWSFKLATTGYPPAVQALAIVKQYRDILSTTERPNIDLTKLLVDFQDWESTKDEDKIYALLSLAAQDLEIEPNYVQSAKETFREATIAVLEKDRRIDWICADRFWFSREDTSLPSWVPDYKGFNFLCSYHNPVYSASLGCSTDTLPFYVEDDVLMVEGQHIDYIESLRKVSFLVNPFRNMMEDDIWFGLWESIPSHKACIELGFLDGAYSDTVWRILLSDCRVDGKRLEEGDLDKYRDEFRGWYHAAQKGKQPMPNPLIPRFKDILNNLIPKSNYTRIVGGDVKHLRFPESNFIGALRRFSRRQLAITRGKRLISVPWYAEVGDEIAVLYNSNTPTLLRKTKEMTEDCVNATGLSVVRLVGSVYAHGLMDGQVIQDPERFPCRIYHIY